MIVKKVSSKWFDETGLRFDCNPYVKGAFEARELINSLAVPVRPLKELTSGHNGGIYNGPVFKRRFVSDEKYGVKFLTSATMLRSRLQGLPLLSKSDAYSKKLSYLELQPEMIMISCSGAIGNTVYVREDMKGYWSCQDQLKVVADKEKIKSGFLYSFLKSKYGIPVVISGTYGAIIQHLEPEHISDLPVPILSDLVQKEVDGLIRDSSRFRTNARNIIESEIFKLNDSMNVGINFRCSHESSFSTGISKISPNGRRFDAFHHVGYVREGIDALTQSVAMSDIASVLRPPLMKRNRVEQGGVEFLGGTELQSLDQKGSTRLADNTRSLDAYIVKEGMVLFQCVGQRYGIFGHPVLANRKLIGKAVTEAVMRVIPFDSSDAGYLSIYLATEVGRRNTLAWSAGTSIPVLQEVGAKKVRVYWPEKAVRRKISEAAERAWELRCQAIELEERAVKLVEDAIKAAAPKH